MEVNWVITAKKALKHLVVLSFFCAQIIFNTALSATNNSNQPYQDGSNVVDYKPLNLENKSLDLDANQTTENQEQKLKKKDLATQKKDLKLQQGQIPEKTQIKAEQKKLDSKNLEMQNADLNLKPAKVIKTRPMLSPEPNLSVQNQFSDFEDFEFDLGFLHSGKKQDISNNLNFLIKSDIPPGKYLVKTRVNRQEIGSFDLIFRLHKDKLSPCLSLELLDSLELDKKLTNNLEYEIGKQTCLPISIALPKGNFDFNSQEMQLDLWIPNTLIAKASNNSFDKDKYTGGDNSLFVKYNLQHYATRNLNQENNHNFSSSNLALNFGANFGVLHLRHSMSLSSSNYSLPKYSYGSTYAQFDIPSWYSQVYFGNIATGLRYMSNSPLLGISFSSDDRMLPITKQGYAPEIQGFANSNAMVSIYQNNVEIYKTNVARGEFVIKDLKAISSNSDLTMLIQEADGTITKRIIPYFRTAALLRKDSYRYRTSLGFFNRGLEVLWKEPILSGEFSYGVHNNVSLTSGLSFSIHRQEAAFALVYNTNIGSFTADANFAHSDILKKHYFGASFGASYSNYFGYTKTNLTLAAYRYTMKNYFELSEVIYLNNKENLKEFKLPNKLKNNFTLYLGQKIPWDLGSLSFNLSLRNYWNKPSFDFYVNFGYSVNIKNMSISLNYYRTQDLSTTKYTDSVGLNFSIPFSNASVANGNFSTSLYLFPNKSIKGKMEFQHSIGVNGGFDKLSRSSYNLSASNSNNKDMSLNANANWRFNKVRFSANVAYSSRNYLQYSFNAEGAMVLHRGGVNLVRELGDTFAIIEAKDGAGANINNSIDNFIDANGYGIVSYISPYYLNDISIDTKGLPFSYEFKSTGSQIIPANLASPIVTFTANKAPAVFVQLSRTKADGKTESLDMGTFVFNSKGEEIGFVGMAGRVYIKNETINDTYSAVWGTQPQDNCFFDLNIPQKDLDSNEIKLYKILCSTPAELDN